MHTCLLGPFVLTELGWCLICKSVTGRELNLCRDGDHATHWILNIPWIPYEFVSEAPMWLCEGVRITFLLFWLVGVVHGWLLGDWVRRHQTVNGFLNSAEQPFAKACGTSVLLCWGLQQAANSGQWRESMTSGAPPPLLTKHTRTISLLSLSYLQSEVWMVSSDATALPIHC